jgi:hypothetical protein
MDPVVPAKGPDRRGCIPENGFEGGIRLPGLWLEIGWPVEAVEVNSWRGTEEF